MGKQIQLTYHKSKRNASINLPGSKSESNRALMIAAYGGFQLRAKRLSDAADTLLLEMNLDQIDASSEMSVSSVIDCENAGTVFRFLTTYLANTQGNWLLTGSYRMKSRPIKSLVDALQLLGAKIRYIEQDGFPPLMIKGARLKGGKMGIMMNESSQYATSVLLAAPTWEYGLELKLEGKLSSMPYLIMTLDIMRHFGIQITHHDNTIHIHPGPYLNKTFTISRDWSAASYWYELVALGGQDELFLKDLRLDSLQGDRVLAEMYSQLGVETHQQANGIRIIRMGPPKKKVKYDFVDCPDLLPTLAATCCGLGVEAVFSGLTNLRHKESDRTAAMATELSKLGCNFEAISEDVFVLTPNKSMRDNVPVFNTYNDHRIAMALAPLAIKTGSVIIDDPDVVVKSYPGFWDELKLLGSFNLEEVSNL